jgi:hypothetical protein
MKEDQESFESFTSFITDDIKRLAKLKAALAGDDDDGGDGKKKKGGKKKGKK